MKELSIEEKAKAYDEAKLRMSRAFNSNRCSIGFMNEIFPELKESEDEKIRKWIIDDIRFNMNNEPLNNSEYRKKAEKAITWLEKQEEKPVEEYNITGITSGYATGKLKEIIKDIESGKVEKFKVGDWVVNKFGDVWHIDSFDKKNYQVSDVKGNYNYFPISKQDEMHLWTIEEAKTGDVLVTKKNNIFIFNSIINCTIYDYCGLYFGEFSSYSAPVNCPVATQLPIDYVPATKEQCDILFAKMKEAGYVWDADMKVLNKT